MTPSLTAIVKYVHIFDLYSAMVVLSCLSSRRAIGRENSLAELSGKCNATTLAERTNRPMSRCISFIFLSFRRAEIRDRLGECEDHQRENYCRHCGSFVVFSASILLSFHRKKFHEERIEAGYLARNQDGNLMETTKHSNIVQGKDHGNRDIVTECSR